MVLLACALLGCRDGAASAVEPKSPARAVRTAHPERGSLDDDVFSANRCGECHGPLEEQWRTSAHGRVEESRPYQAVRQKADPGVACESCHAPLSSHKPVRDEGVTCQACHSIREVKVAEDAPTFRTERDLSDRRMYGPLCDANDHYFHKMGCSPLHEKSLLCASCHHLQTRTPEGERLLVYGEYEEWRRSSYGETEQPCQSCHMPASAAEVAVGEGVREIVPAHRFLTDQMRRRALKLAAEVAGDCTDLTVTVVMTNWGAGHSLPTGSPAREVVVVAATQDEAGRVLAEQRLRLRRVLVDAAGRETWWTTAVREASDTRLRAEEVRKHAFRFQGRCAARVQVRADEHAIAAPLAAMLQLETPPAFVLAETSVTVRRAPRASP